MSDLLHILFVGEDFDPVVVGVVDEVEVHFGVFIADASHLLVVFVGVNGFPSEGPFNHVDEVGYGFVAGFAHEFFALFEENPGGVSFYMVAFLHLAIISGVEFEEIDFIGEFLFQGID